MKYILLLIFTVSAMTFSGVYKNRTLGPECIPKSEVTAWIITGTPMLVGLAIGLVYPFPRGKNNG